MDNLIPLTRRKKQSASASPTRGEAKSTLALEKAKSMPAGERPGSGQSRWAGFLLLLFLPFLCLLEGDAFYPPSQARQSLILQKALAFPWPAPKITGIDAWLHSPPLTLASLRGRVILVNFWTTSSRNALRTLFVLRQWYQRYHDSGLVILGIHTPAFAFEKQPAIVQAALQREEIPWPVALDNHYQTWLNFQNRHWPAHYLIDREGRVIYQSFGETNLLFLENNIRTLLGLPPGPLLPAHGVPWHVRITPETCFGFECAEDHAEDQILHRDHPAQYVFPEKIDAGKWALAGHWQILADRIVSAGTQPAFLRLHFSARRAFVVMGSLQGRPVSVTVLFQGKTLHLRAGAPRLYTVLDLPKTTKDTLTLQAGPGLSIWLATFEG